MADCRHLNHMNLYLVYSPENQFLVILPLHLIHGCCIVTQDCPGWDVVSWAYGTCHRQQHYTSSADVFEAPFLKFLLIYLVYQLLDRCQHVETEMPPRILTPQIPYETSQVCLLLYSHLKSVEGLGQNLRRTDISVRSSVIESFLAATSLQLSLIQLFNITERVLDACDLVHYGSSLLTLGSSGGAFADVSRTSAPALSLAALAPSVNSNICSVIEFSKLDFIVLQRSCRRVRKQKYLKASCKSFFECNLRSPKQIRHLLEFEISHLSHLCWQPLDRYMPTHVLQWHLYKWQSPQCWYRWRKQIVYEGLQRFSQVF